MKKKILIVMAALVAIVLVAVVSAWPREQFVASASNAATAATADNIARGAYLALAGNCVTCHTARGGPAYAGGRAMATPFGALYAPNITPDRTTGIGAWSADDFWRALHNGKSRDGRLLYPAFPYTNYTTVTRADADALYAFLHNLPAVQQANTPHALRFPYNQQTALAAWRLLYFKPGVFAPNRAESLAWNRGAYLVEGLGHCNACHSSRNAAGAVAAGLGGGLIPTSGWYAPSLTSDAEAGLGNWTVPHIVQLLKTGVSPRSTVSGPMAEVVARSLQHMSDADVAAMATYLKSLPATKAEAEARVQPAARPNGPQGDQIIAHGKTLYARHCADCHGAEGRGLAPAYPALAGNRAVTMNNPVNAVRMVLNGGFAPGTAGNPRPYGMPPYSHLMSDAEVAAVVTYLRAAWGNGAPMVSASEVNRYRSTPLN